MVSLSLPIILEYISDHSLEINFFNETAPEFTSYDSIPSARSGFRTDTLYIGTLSEAIKQQKPKNIYMICIRDRERDELETREKLDGIIVINDDMSLNDLLSTINHCFELINEWVYGMQDAIIKGKSETEFLALSEPVIGNYIAISDSALMLVGNTPGIPIDCPVALGLISRGYHSSETVSEFRKMHLLEHWAGSNGIEINGPGKNLSKYFTVGYIFKFKNAYYQHIVMSCNNKEPTQGVIDLFNILIRYLSILIQRKRDTHYSLFHPYDSLLTDLLDGKTIDRKTLDQRSDIVGLSTACWYRLLIIRADLSKDYLLDSLARSIENALPSAKILQYKMSVVILIPCAEKPADKFFSPALYSILEEYDSKCAAGIPFYSLENIKKNYDQVSRLFDITIEKDNLVNYDAYMDKPLSDATRLINFADYPFSFLLAEAKSSRDYWYNCEYHDMLKSLYDYDRIHKTETLNLLYNYISLERKSLATAEVMHMHRNNITHHINHIEEMLNISLDDPAVRMQISCAYLLLRLYGFSKDIRK